MAVVFCGRSALWMWRARVKTDAPIVGNACGEIDDQVKVAGGAVDEAVERVSAVLGERWYGCGVPEVYVPRRISRKRSDFRFYWRKWRTVDTIYPVTGCSDVYVVGPEVALDQIASELGAGKTLLAILELCGTYCCYPDLCVHAKLRVPPVIHADRLHKYVSVCGSSCSSILKEASKYVVDGCASPMEAKVVAIMTLPGRLGGFGLPLPESNVPIVLDAEKSKQFHRTEFYPDFIWRDKKLIVEYDSNEWHFENDASGSKAKRDRKRADALVSLGYIVRSLTAGTLFNYEELCTYMASLQIVLEGRKNRSGDVTASRRKRLSSDILFAQDPLSGIYDSRTYRDRHNGGFHAGAV